MKKFIFKVLAKYIIKTDAGNLWKKIIDLYFSDEKYKKEIALMIEELYKEDEKFKDSLKEEIEEQYIIEELPTYKVSMEDTNLQEKMADLWKDPAFKLYLNMKANKKNFLGKKILASRPTGKQEDALKNALIRGQSLEISRDRAFIKFMNTLYQRSKRSSKKTKGK